MPTFLAKFEKKERKQERKKEKKKKKERKKERQTDRQTDMFVCRLLNVSVTRECISRTDLLRQFYVLPHCDRSCRPNFPSHPVTVY